MKRKNHPDRQSDTSTSQELTSTPPENVAEVESHPTGQPTAVFPVVGIGASAGGLAAFEAFFAAMPADVDPGMAFILVQHLSPNHRSLLVELNRRFTRMKVYEDEALAHIFEPFFTTKEPGKGSGLGLAQAHGIVKQHRGYIHVQTEVGRGTTFTIYLPMVSAPVLKVTAVSQSDPAKGHGEKILVVEDNDSLREGLATVLSMLNYQPLTAANGREALAILEQSAVDLLLCDLIMPEMGGEELLQIMQQHGLAVPVVVLSGHPMEIKEKALQNFSVVSWVVKPPGLKDLAATIAQALQIQPIDG